MDLRSAITKATVVLDKFEKNCYDVHETKQNIDYLCSIYNKLNPKEAFEEIIITYLVKTCNSSKCVRAKSLMAAMGHELANWN